MRRAAGEGELRRAVAIGQALMDRFSKDRVLDNAAALTYYALLAVFPGLIGVVAAVSLSGIGDTLFMKGLDVVRELAPASVATGVASILNGLDASRPETGVALVAALFTALYAAWRYVGGFLRACHSIRGDRPISERERLIARVVATLILVIGLIAATLALLLTGPVTSAIGNLVGADEQALWLWDLVMWPVIVLIGSVLFTLLYDAGGRGGAPIRWVSWGGTLALAGWAVASMGFTAYVRLFGSYERLYGALGAVVAFLVWLWMGNLAFVLGIEANVWLEERRSVDIGASSVGDSSPSPDTGSTVPEAETAEPGVEVPGGGR